MPWHTSASQRQNNNTITFLVAKLSQRKAAWQRVEMVCGPDTQFQMSLFPQNNFGLGLSKNGSTIASVVITAHPKGVATKHALLRQHMKRGEEGGGAGVQVIQCLEQEVLNARRHGKCCSNGFQHPCTKQ